MLHVLLLTCVNRVEMTGKRTVTPMLNSHEQQMCEPTEVLHSAVKLVAGLSF